MAKTKLDFNVDMPNITRLNRQMELMNKELNEINFSLKKVNFVLEKLTKKIGI